MSTYRGLLPYLHVGTVQSASKVNGPHYVKKLNFGAAARKTAQHYVVHKYSYSLKIQIPGCGNIQLFLRSHKVHKFLTPTEQMVFKDQHAPQDLVSSANKCK